MHPAYLGITAVARKGFTMKRQLAGRRVFLAYLRSPFLGRCRASALLGCLVLASVFFMFLPCSTALGNDTAVGGVGGNVYPLSNADIRMRAETVQAVCYRGFAEYLVEFKFVNDGPTQVVKLGFPFLVTVSDFMGNAPVAFRAWRNGEPLQVSLGHGVSQQDLFNGEQSLGYYLHEAEFPRGETTITVSYFALPTVSAGNRLPQLAPPEVSALNISAWDARYNYWVHTGAGWKGKIDKTVVRFSLADEFTGWGVDAALGLKGARADNITGPASYVRVDERTYQWVYEDYQPTEEHDIQLVFDRPNYFWLTGTAEAIPTSWGAMPVIGGASGKWIDKENRPAGWEAIDSDPNTAWDCTGADRPSMEMTIVGNHRIEEVRIIPGRNDALGSFHEYGRPKSVRITLSDGTAEVLTLADEPGLQRFPISGNAKGVQVEVLDSYPGTRSDHSFISEISFGTEPAPEFVDFATLMEGQTPATTEPPTTSVTEAAPSTTGAMGGNIMSTVTNSTSSAELSGSALTTLASRTSVAAEQVDDEGEPDRWAVYLGIAAALIAAVVVFVLLPKLRTRARRS